MIRQTNYCRLFLLSTLSVLMMSGMVGCRYLSIPTKDDVARGNLQQRGNGDAPVYNSAVIKGRIISVDQARASTLVVACQLSAGNMKVAEYANANSQGVFLLYLPQGSYHVYAITDYNHNGIYENDEISGLYGSSFSPQAISIKEGELLTGLVIQTSAANSGKIKLPPGMDFHGKQEFLQKLTHNGQVLKIYHEYFSLENASTGYWQPSSFMKVFGAHIYLAEDYDPRKIPLLFVHGTEGSPHNWIYIYMRLDRSLYQPWFFYYPSGIRLPLAAALLNEELRELQQKLGFKKMGVVAHSVGGLTARSFLTRYKLDKQKSLVPLFMSLATPWSGFAAADISQIIPHKSIPVWLDLGTQSDFIQTTLESRLPPGITHYIFYGKYDKLCGNKALDERAVNSAAQTYGFDCTHDTILSDRNVFRKFREILEKELRLVQ